MKHGIAFAGAQITNSELTDSLVGRDAVVEDFSGRLNIGDHSEVKG